MKLSWNRRETWVGVFDILGFKNAITQVEDDFHRIYLTSQIDDLLETFESDIMQHGKLEFFAFSDTFVIFTQNLSPSSYPWFMLQCTETIKRSIEVRMPLRGAISVGIAYTSNVPPIVMGKAFVEAYEYAEDQDWIGLLLTPSATTKLREAGLEPLHHDFVEDELPLRKMPKQNVLAYRFQNGCANFDSYLLPYLREMHQLAPENAKSKYQRTIDFIGKHYRYINRA
jgi:hypothetical protein